MILWRLPCLDNFSHGEWKCLVDPKVSCCMVNWELIFSLFLNCNIQTWQLGNDQSEAHPNFQWLATTPTLVLEVLTLRYASVVLLSRMITTENEWTCLHRLLQSSIFRRPYQWLSLLMPDKTSSLTKTISTMLQFVGLLLLWIRTLLSLDHTQKFHSGINRLISEEPEYADLDSHLKKLIWLKIFACLLRQRRHWTFKMVSSQFQLIISETTMYSCLIWLQC